MGAAIASKRASDALTVDFAALRVDFAAMRAEFSEVAKAVGARRTVSGTLTIPPLEMRVERSDTGEHQALTTAELERVQQQYDDLATRLQASEQRALVAEAEERGARAENERLEAEKFRAEKAVEAARARSKELRDRVLFVLAFLTPTAAIGAWLLSHYH
jgi:chromosome segregation ATPase